MRLMRKCFFPFALSIALISWVSSASSQEIKCYFSPRGGCVSAICEQLDRSKDSIFVAAYSISEPKITASLIAAHQRGIPVQMIVDARQSSAHYSTAPLLFKSGIRVFIDKSVVLHHNKFMVLDSSIVITGSFNFTDAAERRNAENLLLIFDSKVAHAYLANWRYCCSRSSSFSVSSPRKAPPRLPTLNLFPLPQTCPLKEPL